MRVVTQLEPIFTPRHQVTREQEAMIRLVAKVFPGSKVFLDGMLVSIKP